MTRFDENRFDSLCSRVLDGDATGAERSEFAELLASTPEAGRRYEEFVALESMVFAVGTTDRQEAVAEDPPLPAFGIPIPDEEEEETALAGSHATWIGAALLAAILWLSPSDSPTPISEREQDPAVVGLEVASLSPGQVAIHQPTEDPAIQFIWIGSAPPSEGNRP